jgi:hypothetical protein
MNMTDIIYEIDGETQMIVCLEPEQANAILAEGAFGVTAENLIEVKTYDA